MSQRASVPYPSLFTPPPTVGTGSLPAPRLNWFWLVGSRSGVTVTPSGEVVLSTVRTAAFHIPHSESGGRANWLAEHDAESVGSVNACQSQQVFPVGLLKSADEQAPELAVMSVMDSAGQIG